MNSTGDVKVSRNVYAKMVNDAYTKGHADCGKGVNEPPNLKASFGGKNRKTRKGGKKTKKSLRKSRRY